MKFKTLKYIGLGLSIILTTAYAADSDYWQEFEAKGIPLMQHIQDLAAVPESASASVRRRTKNALAYFFATGGKYGFREAPATDSEYDILVKALAVTTALHNSVDGASVLDLVQVRRGYGLGSEDAMIQSHLLQAQAIIAYRSCMVNYLHPNVSAIRGQDLGACVPFASLESLFSKPTKGDLKSAIINGLTLPVFKIIASTIKPGHFDEAHKSDVKQIKFLLDVILPPKKQPLQVIVSNGEIFEYLGNRTWKTERSSSGCYSPEEFEHEDVYDEGAFIFISSWKSKCRVQKLIFARADLRPTTQPGAAGPFDFLLF